MKSRMFKIPMQFFADGANDDDKNKNGQNDDGQNGQNNNGQQNDDSNKSGNNGNAGEGKKDEKTFNQEQVNKMMAKEKNQGRNAVYNELGINPKDEKQIEAIKAYIESQKSDTQKATEKALAEEKALKEAEDRVRIAEAKAEVMMLGIKIKLNTLFGLRQKRIRRSRQKALVHHLKISLVRTIREKKKELVHV